jgi:hypothetical protein
MNNIKTQIISIELTGLYVVELGKLKKGVISVVMCACLSVRNEKLVPDQRIFMKFYNRVFFENLSTKFNFH